VFPRSRLFPRRPAAAPVRRGVSWPPATCACGAVAPLASARPRRADGHRTPPLTPPSTGPARRGPRRVTPPTRHGPTRHCPRARVLSEARLCHAPINDDPHRLCESETSLGAHLGAHPTRFQSFSTHAPPRDPDAAQRRRRRGRGRWARKVLRASARSPPRARHRALVGTYDPRSWPN